MQAIFPIVAVAFVLFILALIYSVQRWRTTAIRAMADRCGFHYIGEALPRSLTLVGTPFERWTKVWNVIDGEPRGVRIIAFDCRVGSGKQSWTRSIIAVESDADLFENIRTEMTSETSGKWTILYRPRSTFELKMAGLIPVEKLEAYLNAFRAVAVDLERNPSHDASGVR
jgi:hypothetical protein